MFRKNSEEHSYSTRQCNAYRSQKYRTNIRKFTIITQEPKLWNSLPDDIKSKTTTNSFKINLKKYLLINVSKQYMLHYQTFFFFSFISNLELWKNHFLNY